MSEAEEPQRAKSARKPVLPMPRLWKSEPESTPEESLPVKKARKDGETESPTSPTKSKTSKSKGKTKSKAKGPSSADENSEKKVLIEETPALDTYESRRRVRLIVGGLISACIVLLVWIVYRAFLYDPVPMDMTSSGDPNAMPSRSEARSTLDQEAAFH